MQDRASIIGAGFTPGRRSVKTVPFVELTGGRVQGVISSGSDSARVYVAFFEAGTGHYSCGTNNNRPCGGLRGAPCKHIAGMLDEAILQFGAERVVEYLGLTRETEAIEDSGAIFKALRGSEKKEPPGILFSRFLNYLRYCELPSNPGTVLEMGWFVS